MSQHYHQNLSTDTPLQETERAPKQSYTFSLVALTSLFFMWGFLTCMNDILIPYLKEAFDLMYGQAMLIQFCFFGAYFIGSLVYFLLSLSIGDPINRLGYKTGIVIGLVLSGLGLPAVLSRCVLCDLRSFFGCTVCTWSWFYHVANCC